METPHERIRREEVALVKRWFPPGARVLEIGGGSGFQAALLASAGCDIVAIDLEGRPGPTMQGFQKQYWPVQVYDGHHLPFDEASFDVVYTSNMLYHVEALSEFLVEIKRVLRPGGLALHLLPSASWRLWTNLTFYMDVFRRVYRKLRRKERSEGRHLASSGAKRPIFPRVRQWLLPTPLGPSQNTIAEMLGFRRTRWLEEFRRAGYVQIESASGGLFYTGYLMFPELPFSIRRAMAKLLGSAFHEFVMRRPYGPAQASVSGHVT
jgi:ubiquinone/menaquinone biosynthesis C-methylase UbiE